MQFSLPCFSIFFMVSNVVRVCDGDNDDGCKVFRVKTWEFLLLMEKCNTYVACWLLFLVVCSICYFVFESNPVEFNFHFLHYDIN
ncbi:hypothetical protein ACP275_13G168600 [Erythranthe tilingii]